MSKFLRENKLNGSLPGWLVTLAKRKNVTSRRYVDVSENNFTITTSVSNALSNQDVNIFPGCSSNSSTTNLCNSYCSRMKYSRLFINCGGQQVDVDGNTYSADLNPNGASTFFINKTGGWGYSSMGVSKSTSDKPVQFIIQDTCNLTMTAAVLLETARVAPISLKYYGFCFIDDNYTVTLHFSEISLSKKTSSTIRSTRVFDIDIQGKNVMKNYNIEEAKENANGDKIVQYDVSIESQLEIHLY
ncbi:hypothetical protein P3S67_023651 [Capsicum chacoense]